MKHYSKAYDELYNFFCTERNFEHRQRSVYCSYIKMSQIEVYKTLLELTKECPWLKTCLRIMDVTNVGDLHEVTDIISKKIKMQD